MTALPVVASAVPVAARPDSLIMSPSQNAGASMALAAPLQIADPGVLANVATCPVVTPGGKLSNIDPQPIVTIAGALTPPVNSYFIGKKTKRFRDWLRIQEILELRFNDDVIEALGIVAQKTVADIAKLAITIQLQSQLRQNLVSAAAKYYYGSQPLRQALQPDSVREALRRMLRTPYPAMSLGRADFSRLVCLTACVGRYE